MRKAAARLHITPSAMSHSLGRLRDTFDDPLLVKSGSRLEPTSRALKLEEQINIVMEQIGLLMEPEDFDPSKVIARVRVHTHSYVIASYLTPFFAQMHGSAPKLTFETHAFSESSYDQMEKGDVDLIVSAGMDAPAHLMQRRIIEEDMVCMVDQRHPAISNSELISTLPRSMGELGRKLYGHVMLPCPVELPNFVIKAI